MGNHCCVRVYARTITITTTIIIIITHCSILDFKLTFSNLTYYSFQFFILHTMHHLTNLSSSSSSSVRAPNQQYQSNRVPTKPSPQYYTPLSPETYGRQTQSSSSYFRSTTYSEFTGRSQQHSGPVHPPHPSRSSLAVARSLSERSKEPEMPHEDQSNESKSYADQIDEVMEQFNANCDISMDDLFGAANSASTSTLNASTSTDKDGKPIRSGKGKGNQSQSGLTKKSSSTSQLSVSGKWINTFFLILFG